MTSSQPVAHITIRTGVPAARRAEVAAYLARVRGIIASREADTWDALVPLPSEVERILKHAGAVVVDVH